MLYLGRTKQKLQTRPRGHFFNKPMHRHIYIDTVKKIEYAEFKTEADMFLYEIYLINKLKPPLNRDDKAADDLTVNLPFIEFKEFNCNLMDKWGKVFKEHEEKEERRKKARKIYFEELREMRKKFRAGEITEDEYYDFKEKTI